jgi:hypothetical protein
MARERRRPKEPSDDDAKRREEEAHEAQAPPSRVRAVPVIRDLKIALETSDATWTVNELLSDGDELPQYPMGGDPTGLTPASAAPPVDFAELSQQVPANPHMVARRLELGLVHPDLIEHATAFASEALSEEQPPHQRPNEPGSDGEQAGTEGQA